MKRKDNREIENARLYDMDEEQLDIELGAMLGLLPPRELTAEQEQRIQEILNEPDEEADHEQE